LPLFEALVRQICLLLVSTHCIVEFSHLAQLCHPLLDLLEQLKVLALHADVVESVELGRLALMEEHVDHARQATAHIVISHILLKDGVKGNVLFT